jgi:cell division septum initiation protein DivIVA
VPIQTQDQIIGVLELASLYEIDQNKIDFVTKACEGIASAIISTQITQRVQLLLSEAQQQAEEMRSQEEEMRQNMEELSATQEEMQRKEQEYIAKIDRLEAALNLKDDNA